MSGAPLHHRFPRLFVAASLVAVMLAATPAGAAAVPASVRTAPGAATVGVVPSGAGADAPAAPTALTVGQLPAPMDIENLIDPLLGWQLTAAQQTAYQVQVSASTAGFDDNGLLWDSGRQASGSSTNVAYAGPTLTSSTRYSWRVRHWDGAGRPSAWSAVAEFGTGPGPEWDSAEPIWLPDARSQWSDYTLEADFRIVAQNATIVFRATDSNNYYMWQLRGNGVNTLAPHKRVNGTFTQLSSVPLGATLETGTDHHLRITATGDTITTYLDEQLIDTTVDSTFDGGGIGFRTGGSERNSWDNLSVTSPEGDSLYRNTFDAPSTDFSCGSVTGGRLTIGTSQNCVHGVPRSDWAFLRGEVTPAAGKQVASATLFATGASAEPTKQYVYKLWLNGEFVGLGPTRSIGTETRYDGYDVSDLLTPGTANAIGALAYTTRDQRFLARLVINYTDGSSQIFGTGADWTALSGDSVYPEGGSIGTGYFVAPKENLQSDEYPNGFATPDFDDSHWSAATVKAPFELLAATPTAKVQQRLEFPAQVVERAPGHYFIDYGRTWVGGLSLDLDGTAGQVLDIRFGEALSAPQTVRYAMATGNNYQDRWTLRDGRQHLESWGMRVFRYAEVIGAPTGLTTDDFPALAQIYPFDNSAGRFDSSDESLNQVWALSRNTIEATNGNLFVDSWTRERGAYEADTYLQMMANFYLSADPTLGNYSLDYLLTVRTWPTEWPMYLILAYHDSYLQTGDTEALGRNYEALKGKLPTKWIEESTGLVRKDSGSNGSSSCTDCDIVDWPTSERDGYVFRPYNTVINAISYRSYLDMADIAAALGKTDDAEAFTVTGERLRAVANERLFDETTGAYRDGLNADGTPVDHFAVQASAFATAFGLADADRAARASDYLDSRGMACSVYCAAFVLEALYAGDRGDAAHGVLTDDGLRSWLNMIASGAGATMEAWDLSLKSNTTYSHPWAASPAYNIPQGMFGIRPTTPGYATVDIKPQPSGVQRAMVTVPTLRGSIGAAFHTVTDRSGSQRTDVGVDVPGNTTARVHLPAGDATTDTMYVDGVAVRAVLDGGYLRIDDVGAGCHVISRQAGTTPRLDHELTRACDEPYAVVLDDFSRRHMLLGPDWAGTTTSGSYRVSGNALAARNGGPVWWAPASFGSRQEAAVTLTTIDPTSSATQGVLLKVAGTRPGRPDPVRSIAVTYGAGQGVRVTTTRDGDRVDYPWQQTEFTDGDRLTVRAGGNGVIEVFRNGEPVSTVELAADDQAYFDDRGGAIGLWTDGARAAVLDDFGGGTLP